MKKIPLLILILILIASCNSKQTSSELEKLTEKLTEKEKQISDLQTQIENLENKQTSDYYRFMETSDSEINVVEKLKSGERKLIDKKDFKDTLDISDNFFVYKHTSEITQTSESEFESVLRDFDQVKSEYGNDFFVRVMTFYNGQSLPLETENSKTDIHILIQPTELGYENKTIVISDFYDVEIKTLEKKENSVELTFEHGKFPRKSELIIIKPELVKFGIISLIMIFNSLTYLLLLLFVVLFYWFLPFKARLILIFSSSLNYLIVTLTIVFPQPICKFISSSKIIENASIVSSLSDTFPFTLTTSSSCL